MALWPSPGDLFGIAVRSQEALEEAVNYCLHKQARVQKVVGSSPMTSWENVVRGEHERGLTHPLTDDTEGHFGNDPLLLTLLNHSLGPLF